MGLRPLAALAVVSMAAACAGDVAGPIVRADAHPDLSAISRAELMTAAQGRTSRGFEDEILRMQTRIPGLGGVFLDPTSGQVVVYLKNLGQQAAAMNELRNMAPTLNVDPQIRAKLGVKGTTVVRQGRFAFSDLVAYVHAISAHVRVPGFLSIDADEVLNRVRVTTSEGASRDAFAREIATLGVPDSAIVFDTALPARSESSLQDRLRPTGGGVQIVNASGSLCSLGFNVDVQVYNQKGFLTASHCDYGVHGNGGTGASIYQNTVSISNRIGTVSINPPWNLTDSGCRGYSRCTDADAMYVQSTDASSANWLKRIYSTTVWGANNSPGSLTVSTNWSGIAIVPFIVAGQTVYKVGRTTGVTSGIVAATCENPLIDSTQAYPYVVLCAARVTGASHGPGDSGGPVFYPSTTQGDPPYAIGILFAGSGAQFDNSNRCTASCSYYFSDWYAVRSHLSRYFLP